MKKKGNKKMPIPRQKIIDNPIHTSLLMCYAAVLLCVGTGGAKKEHVQIIGERKEHVRRVHGVT